ncbi:MAG: response regulator transcription factor [Treponema sp.]|jgi:DNA-binding NarL/FixJ family response regulator|nr:response regulator transcription factor [Treponema sp.]
MGDKTENRIGAKKNIIIVEDHPVMRKSLANWFAETGGWRILGLAASLDKALVLAGEKTDVVVLDIQLEGVWGLDLVPRLRERLGKAAPPCVVYSAFDDWAHINAALNMGVRGYVSKKSDETELEKALLTVIAGGEYVEKSLMEHLEHVTGMVERLTRRETEIWNLAREGLSSRRIGACLCISPRTVDNVLSIIYDKTGLRNRRELMKL